jgi:hypothetical protein
MDWTKAKEHIEMRSTRHAGDVDILTDWANEAELDPRAISFEPDYASISGKANRLIGFSKSAGFVITVIYMYDAQNRIGVPAWKSSKTDIRHYKESAKGGSYDK